MANEILRREGGRGWVLPLLLTLLVGLGGRVCAESSGPLRLVHTIALAGVEGRIDHMTIDVAGKRLFVAALGNGSLEILDLSKGSLIRSIRELDEPQGVLYLPELQRILITNGGDGTCRAFDSNSLQPLFTLKFSGDADNIRYDRRNKRIYVGYGRGALGIVDPEDDKIEGEVKLPGHPESFQLEELGRRAFVNVPTAWRVAVVDREKRHILSSWRLGSEMMNFPMALDEANHRLFVGCRLPANILVFDTESGRIVAKQGISKDVDDLFYDATRKRIYASCGEGFVDVIEQVDPDRYMRMARVPTAVGARTSLFVAEQDRLYLAVPLRGVQQAEIRVYAVEQ